MENIIKLVNALGRRILDEISIRQLSIEAKIPYTTTHRTISANKGLFLINEKSNIKFCSLNNEDDITKHYLIISERKKQAEFLNKKPEYRMLTRDLPAGRFSVILFGSRASDKGRDKSDIDICILSADGKRSASFSSAEIIMRLEINPIFMSAAEFSGMLKKNGQNLAKEIITNHVILYGEEYFWEVIWNAVRQKNVQE